MCGSMCCLGGKFMLRLVPHPHQSPPVRPCLCHLSRAQCEPCERAPRLASLASRSSDGSEPGEGAVSAGYLVPSTNPSAPASGGAASKPGADSAKEWMSVITEL